MFGICFNGIRITDSCLLLLAVAAITMTRLDRHWLIVVYCIVTTLCVLQQVEGGPTCYNRCNYRCSKVKTRHRIYSYWDCDKRCNAIARNCDFCAGPKKCLRCASGYKKSYSSRCVVYVEVLPTCSTNNGGCSANAWCTDLPGGGVNCACKTGFTGNGKTCTDIDECVTNYGGCSTAATCKNGIGGYTCTCNTGYTGNGTFCTGWTLTLKDDHVLYIYANEDEVYVGTNPPPPPALPPQPSFLILPCLAPNVLSTAPSSRCVSLMPEYWSGYYVRHQNFQLYYAQRTTGTGDTFDQDASFIMVQDQFYGGYVAFQSVNYPSYYIHARLDLSDIVKIDQFDGTDTFRDDASFVITPTSSVPYSESAQ